MHRRLSHSLLVIWLFAAAPAWAAAQPTLGDADKAAIHQVIASQIAALQKDDGAAAFAFATPSLRERFGSAANFMSMVREGYRPVYRTTQVSFGKLERSDEAVIQHVAVVSPDGVVNEALYFMERQKNGTWLVGGCLLTESELKSS